MAATTQPIKVTRTGDKRLELAINGRIETEHMRKVLEDVLALSEGMEHGELLYTIENFEMPSLAALAVEMQYLPRLFALISRIDKAAVLTDTGWIAKAAEIEGALIPGLTIKSFGLTERAAAEAWLSS